MTQRIGLFGGSFNPVHLGHLLVAQAAREELQLDRIVFTPAAMSPFKPGLELAPAAQRLRLLRLALAGRTYCEIDDQEIRRGGISYTIETVREYRCRGPEARLFYLIGADHVPQLPLWRDAEELARLVEFVVIPRPGQAFQEAPAPFRSHPLRGFPLGVSASQIRDRVRDGLPIDSLVPPLVAEAILAGRMYSKKDP
ncbi:MAG: nicotinate (nicotinamide) nucleotide adenylyltransferase [Verrucomicrobia bacterium]|nr:nicotinate (nicotinamide) nucleotide adenylyltransferase [Verrucomicrobiota bacterium]